MHLPLSCPKCGESKFRNDGSVRGNKRYRCNHCGTRFTVPIHKVGRDLKRRILVLYLEGFSFRETGKMLGITHVTVSKTVKELLPNAIVFRKKDKPLLIEMEQFKALFPSNQKGHLMFVSKDANDNMRCYFIIESYFSNFYGNASKE